MTTEDRVSWALLCMHKGDYTAKHSINAMQKFHNGDLHIASAKKVIGKFVNEDWATRFGGGHFRITPAGRKEFMKWHGKKAYDQERLGWDQKANAKTKVSSPKTIKKTKAAPKKAEPEPEEEEAAAAGEDTIDTIDYGSDEADGEAAGEAAGEEASEE